LYFAYMDDLNLQLPNQLGPHLRSLRRARKMTQRDLAVCLGVTQARVAAIEANPAVVSVGQLMTILAALGVDIALRPRPATDAVARATPPTVTW
jgi:HTH-type transcriptional regulator / antitoxin HipB